ncbi:MAG: Gfo/Idh/MocA family oxidoreductase [Armatimonadetes bacterium]|nr:Gfo/Idh/MocA family oxidoreductase [Armatimonadota bacterium]
MKLRCGVAGLGRGRLFVEWLNALPECEVVAVCDSNSRALDAFSGLKLYTDFEQFIWRSDLDIVAVITPGPEHAPQSLLAMEAGVHVISETPCVYSLEQAEAIVRTANQTGRKYMLAEDYIWMGWTLFLQDLRDRGILGELLFAESEYTHDCRGGMLYDSEGRHYPVSAWGTRPDLKPTWRASDLPPLFYCSHTLGPLLHLMDDRCVSAVGMNTGAQVAPEVCPTDMESGLLKTAKGKVIRLTNGFCIAHPFSFYLGLYGSRGSVRMVNLGGDKMTRFYTDDEADKGWQPMELPWEERPDGRHWMQVMLGEYVQAIINDTEPPLDPCRSMDVTVPGICAHLSAERGGELVEVPDFRTLS